MKILFYDTKKYDRDSFEKVVTDFPDGNRLSGSRSVCADGKTGKGI